MNAAPGAYDPVELRRRIAVCFSVGELRQLAESLGVGTVPWERGIDEAAREVVRQSERYAGLPALVAKLRETRPLVEWPEPIGAPAPPAPMGPSGTILGTPIATVASADGDAPVAVPPALAPAPTGFAPAVMAVTMGNPVRVPQTPPVSMVAQTPAVPVSMGSPAPAPGPTLSDPYAPPPGPPAFQPPPAVGPPRAPWPGTTQPVQEAPRGLDPRILVAVAAMTVAAAVIAYIAGRASSPAAAPAASTEAAAATPNPHADGVAGHAATAIARSYANLARVCELPASAGRNELVFNRVFERCGRAPLPRYPSGSSSNPAAAPRSDAPDAPPDRGRGGRGAPRGGDAPPSPPAARGCIATCDAQVGACRARCGPEPVEASAFGGWQACQGGCVKDSSRCKMSCH